MIDTCFSMHHQDIIRDFINIFSKMATGFHSRAKLFELNVFVRKTLH